MSAILSNDQLGFYRENGYLLVKNVIPDDVLNTVHDIIEPWADMMIETWHKEGLISEADKDERLDFNRRLLYAWQAAGSPIFRRSPFRNFINKETYHLFRHPTLLTLAEELLGTTEISMHGIFNHRVCLPGAWFTETPWHHDSQDMHLWDEPTPEEDRFTHVVTMWIPMQRVHKGNGCLQVASMKETGERIFPPFDYGHAEAGLIGLTPKDVDKLQPAVIEMDRSDVLVFTQNTVHAAVKNTSDEIRWSFDVRYEATQTATVIGKKYGFIAQSRLNPESVTPCEDWLNQRQT